MITLQASKIASIVGGTLVGGDLEISGEFALNSKMIKPGGIFIALAGEKVDGHDFISDAFSNGALLAISSRDTPHTHILVGDVTQALTTLAQFIRDQLQALTVIAITGSQGKTTTKDLLRHLLLQYGPTVAPEGNYNNELGVPLTLLQCTSETKFCIIEMGARHKGDIAFLASIAKPNIGVVLRVGLAHLGEFGSIETIAETKSELISALSNDGIAILGDYDSFTPAMSKLHEGRVITFGQNNQDTVRATEIDIREGRAHFDLVTPAGRAAVGLRIVGEHQVANALACAAVVTALGYPLDSIATGLSTAVISSKWRMEIHEFCDVVLINDSYNASPDAVEAALKTLILFAQERGGRSWAFLGKMAELGESSADEHQRIGTLAYLIGVDHLVCINAPEYETGSVRVGSTTLHICGDQEGALDVARNIEPGDVILVKASRSQRFEILAAGIEEVIRSLNEDFESREGEVK